MVEPRQPLTPRRLALPAVPADITFCLTDRYCRRVISLVSFSWEQAGVTAIAVAPLSPAVGAVHSQHEGSREARLLEAEMLETDAEELSWQERALCAQTDPEAFFPEKGGSTREAKRVCLTCDVRGECLDYALANDERFGIWGGLSERERRKLKKSAV